MRKRLAGPDFARELPKSARVLDLATGDGCVMRWMLSVRSDLKLTGVDLAPTLPSAPRGTTIKSGVAMEKLPFPDHRFHCITSQFGFEYGDIARSALEVARVLRDDGRLAIMVHRGDGPILEHNVGRREQISWVLSDRKLDAQVKAALTMGLGGGQAALSAAENAVRDAAANFGQDGPAWEIAEAIRRSILMGARSGARSIVETVAAITAQARNEVGRIDSLERACGAADDRDTLVGAMAEAGLSHAVSTQVDEPSGRAFADFLTFSN